MVFVIFNDGISVCLFQSCDIGWRRIDDILYGGTCIPCDCYGHSKTCDPYTGRCLVSSFFFDKKKPSKMKEIFIMYSKWLWV